MIKTNIKPMQKGKQKKFISKPTLPDLYVLTK